MATLPRQLPTSPPRRRRTSLTLGISAVVTMANVQCGVAWAATGVVDATCRGQTATIAGTDGDDQLVGTEGPDVIVAGRGDDTVTAYGGDDLVCGGRGDDMLVGGPGADVIEDGLGIDAAFGGRGADRLFARAGVEHVFGDELHGGRGPDVLRGGPDDDRLWPGAGVDRVYGGAAADVDTVVYDGARRGVTVDLRAGTASGQGADRLVDVAAVIGSRHADRLLGDEDRNFIDGGLARGTEKRLGRDLIRGRAGDDVLGSAVCETGCRVAGSDWGDDAIFGGPGDDDLSGGPGTEVAGQRGRDSIYVVTRLQARGGRGADSFYVLRHAHGAVEGGAGQDVVRVVGLDGGVTLDLADGVVTGNSTRLELRQIENAFGGDGDDRLRGDDGPNRLFGFGGRDVLRGRAGDDFLDGGVGADRLNGGAGSDVCVPDAVVRRCEA